MGSHFESFRYPPTLIKTDSAEILFLHVLPELEIGTHDSLLDYFGFRVIGELPVPIAHVSCRITYEQFFSWMIEESNENPNLLCHYSGM